jgi:GDP-L-fucose synthase
MKILITGGTGMAGAAIINCLKNKNHELHAPTRGELDLACYDSTINYIKQNSFDMVVHSAGYVGGIKANVTNPVDFLIKNLDIGRNLIIAAYVSGIKKVINLASSCIYPKNAQNPLKEEMILSGPLEPTNEGYALAKIITMRLCEYINREKPEFQYKTMIPCNLYGPNDKFDKDNAHLVPAIINKLHNALQNNEEFIEIWGNGTAKREFMYVGDLADAICFAVDNFTAMPIMLNIGVGEDHTINEYYTIIAEIVGYKGSFRYNIDKPVGMLKKLVSIEKQSSWGWHPNTPLKEGIKKTYEFYLKEIEA